MALSRLDIHGIRNLRSVGFDSAPGFNGFYGPNGSGKTSILEAIHILGRGGSFRTRDLGHVLQDGATVFRITGRVGPLSLPMGVQYQPSSPQFRINGQPARSRLQLAQQLPLLFISPESHALIAEGPQQRRRFLDWGLFHVEPRFFPAWRRYHRALKQRNKALGAGVPAVEAWDIELGQAAEEITRQRYDYLRRLEPYVRRFLSHLTDLGEVDLQFFQGWRHGQDYLAVLKSGLQHDRNYGFTRQGPHRADVTVRINSRPARDMVSRGQQKLLVIALLLAQVALLNQEVSLSPVILMDDLAAELDLHHQRRLLEALCSLQAQVFLTVTERSLIAEGDTPIYWFHVEQGQLQPA
jgi:DNA replication and repair protein RecF